MLPYGWLRLCDRRGERRLSHSRLSAILVDKPVKTRELSSLVAIQLVAGN